MVEMEHIVHKLEETIGTTLVLKTLNTLESSRLAESIAASGRTANGKGNGNKTATRSITSGGSSAAHILPATEDGVDLDGVYIHEALDEVWFPVEANAKEAIRVIAARRGVLTESEMGLISLLLANLRTTAPETEGKLNGKVEEERHAQQLGSWIKEQLHAGELLVELPDELQARTSIKEEMIAFLIINGSEHAASPSYKALQRLLNSYFDGDILLIPLQEKKEWVILAKQELLNGITSDDKEEAALDGDQDLLFLFCMGLYELISTEWVGDFHISAIPSVHALHALPQTVSLLRETITIGRTFQVKEHIHLSTGLHLERLVYSIPEYQRNQFLREYAAGHTDLFEDSETLSTLESFFELDCNVSETAKHLYIHRNTLLYRLDKIKQETGLDVRSFSDAVLVKITLLLYKVTKRK